MRKLDFEKRELRDYHAYFSTKKRTHEMNSYSQLSLEERYTFARGLAKRDSMKLIALAMNRHISTLYRERKRNLRPSGFYAAAVANSYAVARNHECHRGSQFSEDVWSLIKQKLRQQWSPEQISNTFKLEGICSISVATIYRMIAKDRRRGGGIYKDLRIMPKRRRKRYRSVDYRGKLKGKKSIKDRPIEAQERTEFGHWEADTVMGANRFECVLTVVERKTGYAETAKIRHRTATQVYSALANIISKNPHWFKTITFDNGTEFHNYVKIEKRFNVMCYFASPHAPWQRGSNENFNGLLRQYIPKGSSLKNIGNSKLNYFCKKLNTRPRKRLHYKSPQEKVYELFSNSHF